jgi:Ca2+-binding EF-hand superfamily protein
MKYELTPTEENLALNIFDALDNDQDGILTSQDYTPTGHSPVDVERARKVHHLFDLFDTNKDGSVSKTEFLTACEKLITKEASIFEDLHGQHNPAANEEEIHDLEDAKERTARQYLYNTLINIAHALSTNGLAGALPTPPPPNRADSTMTEDDGDGDGNGDGSGAGDRDNGDHAALTRFPVIGESVIYVKPGIPPRPAVVVSLHPFSNVYDPLYKIKLIEENIEFETYSYYLQLVDDGNNTEGDSTSSSSSSSSSSSKNNTSTVTLTDEDGDIKMGDTPIDVGAESHYLHEFITPKAYLPEADTQVPPACLLTNASRDAAYSLYRLFKFAANGPSSTELFYPHRLVTSTMFQTFDHLQTTYSVIIDAILAFKPAAKAADVMTFEELLLIAQSMGQMYTDQKWTLRQYYYPVDRRIPQTNHIVSLANIELIHHLNQLENVTRMALQNDQDVPPAMGGTVTSATTESSTVSSSSSSNVLIEFIMDPSTSRKIRDFFRKLDTDGDGEIEWHKDYIAKYPQFYEYNLARFQQCLQWFDTNNDQAITFEEFNLKFQLEGYTWVANRKVQDVYDSKGPASAPAPAPATHGAGATSIPAHMLTKEYQANVQIEANTYVKLQVDFIENFIFHDKPTMQMIDGIQLKFVPDQKTNTLMNTFWTWISSDRNGLPNYVVHQNVFGTQYCMGLRVRKAIYILENEHS